MINWMVEEFIEGYLEDGSLGIRIAYEYGFEPNFLPEYQEAMDWLETNNIKTVADLAAFRRAVDPNYKLPSERNKAFQKSRERKRKS
jgi:hypothetical protein